MINLNDNSEHHLKQEELQELQNLMFLNGIPMKKLYESYPNLLWFPPSENDYGDDINDLCVFQMKGTDVVSTGNLMGFIGKGETRLCIHSRFDKGNDVKNYFLHYMLQEVLATHITSLTFDGFDDECFDFLIYLFPYHLKEALRQGIYREYVTRNHNDAQTKGIIDIARHIKNNIPANGCVAYNTREYDSDNSLTQLIRHTIEYIRKHEFGSSILNCEKYMKECVDTIIEATPTYDNHELSKVIGNNLRPISHPYYQAYRDLQDLCMRILRFDGLMYGDNDDDIYGILFDGAWLWESFLNHCLEPLGFTHTKNIEKINGKQIYCGRKIYPDYYISDKVVVDAKYKYVDASPSREDLFQVVSYMHALKCPIGALVYPSENGCYYKQHDLYGLGGVFSTTSFHVLQSRNFNDYQLYCDAMISKKNEFVNKLSENIDNDVRFTCDKKD